MNSPHDSWAQVYDEVYRRSFGGFLKTLTDATLECVKGKIPAPARIVDYGAGTGRLALPLARAGYQVTAVEPSAEMLSVLKSRAEACGLDITCQNCRMQDTFDAEPFDFATCVFTVISYLPDEEALTASLTNAARSLKIGGRLLIDVPQRRLFRSNRWSEKDFDRKVDVTQVLPDIYDYDEKGRIQFEGRMVDYADRFRIRCWDPSVVTRILSDAGMEIEEDQSPVFQIAAANYYLATRNR